MPIVEYDFVDGFVLIDGQLKKIYHHYRGYLYVANDGGGSIGVHRYIIQKALGRKLGRKWHVHHKNGDKQDNRPTNLEIINASDHNRYHTTIRNTKYDPLTFICKGCNKSTRHKARGLCSNCWEKRRRKELVKRACCGCGIETVNRYIYDGLCCRCSCKRFSKCIECFRSPDEIIDRHKIGPLGLCRACVARIERRSSKNAKRIYTPDFGSDA